MSSPPLTLRFPHEHAATPEPLHGQLRLRAFVPAEASAYLSWLSHSSARISYGARRQLATPSHPGPATGAQCRTTLGNPHPWHLQSAPPHFSAAYTPGANAKKQTPTLH